MLIVPDARQTFFLHRIPALLQHTGYCLKASPHVHPEHMEWYLITEAVPYSSAFIIQHLVFGRLLIACLPVSLGLGRNWYQLLADFQATLPWQPPWKAFRRKRMTLSAEIDQLLDLQILLHTVRIHDQPPDCVCDVFNLKVWVGGCFGREHFPLFLSGTVWYAALLHCDNARLVAELKAGFVCTNSSEETKVHEKLLPLLQLLNLTSCPPYSESNPHSRWRFRTN